jgi:hypothetical protein
MTSIKYLHEIVTSTLTLLLSIVCWYYLSCLVYLTLSSQLCVLPFDSCINFLQGKLYLLLLGTTALSLVPI